MATTLDDLEQLTKEYEKKMREEGEVALKNFFMDTFDKAEDLIAIGFVGYVPSFNDGDPCVFGLGEIAFQVEGIDEEDADAMGFEEVEEEGDPHFVTTYYLTSHAQHSLFETVEAKLCSNKDLLNRVFGDNFKLTVTRFSIVVDEYDCGW